MAPSLLGMASDFWWLLHVNALKLEVTRKDRKFPQNTHRRPVALQLHSFLGHTSWKLPRPLLTTEGSPAQLSCLVSGGFCHGPSPLSSFCLPSAGAPKWAPLPAALLSSFVLGSGPSSFGFYFCLSSFYLKCSHPPHSPGPISVSLSLAMDGACQEGTVLEGLTWAHRAQDQMFQ